MKVFVKQFIACFVISQIILFGVGLYLSANVSTDEVDLGAVLFVCVAVIVVNYIISLAVNNRRYLNISAILCVGVLSVAVWLVAEELTLSLGLLYLCFLLGTVVAMVLSIIKQPLSAIVCEGVLFGVGTTIGFFMIVQDLIFIYPFIGGFSATYSLTLFLGLKSCSMKSLVRLGSTLLFLFVFVLCLLLNQLVG